MTSKILLTLLAGQLSVAGFAEMKAQLEITEGSKKCVSQIHPTVRDNGATIAVTTRFSEEIRTETLAPKFAYDKLVKMIVGAAGHTEMDYSVGPFDPDLPEVSYTASVDNRKALLTRYSAAHPKGSLVVTNTFPAVNELKALMLKLCFAELNDQK